MEEEAGLAGGLGRFVCCISLGWHVGGGAAGHNGGRTQITVFLLLFLFLFMQYHAKGYGAPHYPSVSLSPPTPLPCSLPHVSPRPLLLPIPHLLPNPCPPILARLPAAILLPLPSPRLTPHFADLPPPPPPPPNIPLRSMADLRYS